MSQIKDVLKRAVGPAELKRVLNLRASDSDVNTDNFSNQLTTADDTVQKALETLDGITTFTGELTSTDAGATAAPALDLYRNSVSPADNDEVGEIRWYGEDSADNKEEYATDGVRLIDVTSTEEDAERHFSTVIAGTLAERLVIGAGVYTAGATGGDQGADTVNASTIYANGVELTNGGRLVAIIEDQKTSGTDGGTFTSGADQSRDLNTIVYNRDSTVSLNNSGAGPGFTLPAGDWEISWSTPAKQVNEHQSFLYNTSDSTEIKRGTSEKTVGASGDGNRSFGSARVSIAGSKTYEIRHRCNTTRSTDGLGDACSFGTEVYTRVIIRENGGNDVSAGSAGGLTQEASATADGTAEHLQVTATSTPSAIKRMVCLFKGIVPEIDGDQLSVTVILDDDSELTSASYDHVGYRNIAGTGADVSTTGDTGMKHGDIGNASGEYFNGSIVMESANGSDTVKTVVFNAAYTNSAGQRVHFRRSFFISTSNAIKGFRIDTDNAGDMINAGEMELLVQT